MDRLGGDILTATAGRHHGGAPSARTQNACAEPVPAADGGIAAVQVSNRGGRRIDGAFAALPCVVEAVVGRIPAIRNDDVQGKVHVSKAWAVGVSSVALSEY